MTGPKGEEVFESYTQNKTPGDYRIFWYYGPKRNNYPSCCHTTSINRFRFKTRSRAYLKNDCNRSDPSFRRGKEGNQAVSACF